MKKQKEQYVKTVIKAKKAKNISISMIMEQNWKIKKKMNIKFY